VTLRELLYHTSGLPNYTADPEFLGYFVSHLKDFISPQQVLSFVTDQPLVFPNGTRYEYSNTDNLVIGLMAERATGRSYEQLLRDLVWRPLGLRRTSFPSGFLLPRPFVSGYVFDAPGQPLENVSEEISVSSVWAAGAIVSTPADQNRFIRAWGSGRLLSRKLRRQQTNFIPGAAGEPPGPGQNSGGLTLFRYKLPCGTVFGHTGNFPGYTQFIASSPDGSRSTSVSANLQLDVATGPPGVFPVLHDVFRLAACAALAGS
jgi:D-alanyl-D-alanine carboxypeptidase